MFKKSITSYLLIVLLCVCSFIAYTQNTISSATFPLSSEKKLVEVYISLNTQSCSLTSKGPAYQAAWLVEVEIIKGDRKYDTKKYYLQSPLIKDTLLHLQVMDVLHYELEQGEYSIVAEVKDSASGQPITQYTQQLSINIDTLVNLSDILFLKSFDTCTTGILCKYGRKLVPHMSTFYNTDDDTLNFICEAQDQNAKKKSVLWQCAIRKIDESDKPIVLAKQYKTIFNKQTVWLQPLDISRLISGTYLMEVQLLDSTNSVLAKQTKQFRRFKRTTATQDSMQALGTNQFIHIQSIDSLREFLRCITPIAKAQEALQIRSMLPSATVQQLQSFLYSFWLVREQHDPYRAFVNYLHQVSVVQAEFGTHIKKGYNTDRGRIYLKYGKPNSMVNQLTNYKSPYQIWHYYTLEKQKDVKLIFINDDLISNDYRLVYSTIIGEQVDLEPNAKAILNDSGVMNKNNTSY